MDAFASIKACRFQDPNILAHKVAHWHDQSTWFACELLDSWASIALLIRDDVLISYVLAPLRDQDRERIGYRLIIRLRLQSCCTQLSC
jgi:hypothetical protein